jgi:hypothetical protein
MGLRDHLRTYSAAAGPHPIRTASIVGLATYTVATNLESFLAGRGVTLIPTLNSAFYTVVAIILLSIWWLLHHATQLRQAAEPRLILSFENTGPGIQLAIKKDTPNVLFAPPGTFVPGSERKGMYVRIRIDTSSDANVSGCSAALVGLAIRKANELEFTEVELPQVLAVGPEKFEVRPLIPYRLDILNTDQRDNTLRPAPAILWPFLLSDIFVQPATFRLDIAVNDGRKTKLISIEIDWNGKWNDIKGHEVKQNVSLKVY